jgi:hypothetical protein
VALAEVPAGAFSPGADEIIVQAGADHRPTHRTEASRHFFDYFCAGLPRELVDDPEHETADHFFFQQLAADINAGGGGGYDPQFCSLFLGVELEP